MSDIFQHVPHKKPPMTVEEFLQFVHDTYYEAAAQGLISEHAAAVECQNFSELLGRGGSDHGSEFRRRCGNDAVHAVPGEDGSEKHGDGEMDDEVKVREVAAGVEDEAGPQEEVEAQEL
ncbi:hypothetical protein B9Z65_7457 [Elsinoe australis]|uniref:Uncharacterized protein n=1 Tax=Elsinoe australis TaxID=40998 RepID=A0A2P7YC86_9PEZI|nr:hypothetical protein B9Z65_7457 [Elsinoe australis]